MKDLIERIARALVDNPEEVAVTALEGSQATVLELKVAKEDLGKIIGLLINYLKNWLIPSSLD